jgi:hypothetical protein
MVHFVRNTCVVIYGFVELLRVSTQLIRVERTEVEHIRLANKIMVTFTLFFASRLYLLPERLIQGTVKQ